MLNSGCSTAHVSGRYPYEMAEEDLIAGSKPAKSRDSPILSTTCESVGEPKVSLLFHRLPVLAPEIGLPIRTVTYNDLFS